MLSHGMPSRGGDVGTSLGEWRPLPEQEGERGASHRVHVQCYGGAWCLVTVAEGLC